MARKQQKKSSKSSNTKSQNINVLINDLKLALLHLRGRKAVSVCKLLFNNSGFKIEDYDKVIVRAYEIRILELLNGGELIQAEQMFETLLKNYPQLKDLFPVNLYIKMELLGGKIEILTKYSTDKYLTQKINDFVLNHLYDLRLIINLKTLPDNYFLKQEAVILLNAWEEVECNEESLTAYNLMLKVVNRQSPYKNWRMLIQALKAFYSNDDEIALKCISKIDENSPVLKIAAFLRELLSGIDNRKSSITINKLREKIYGYSVKNSLSMIDKMLDDKSFSAASKHMSELIKSEYFTDKKLLLKLLMAVFIRNNDGDLHDVRQLMIEYGDFKNSYIQTMIPYENDPAELWIELVENKSNHYSNIEKALIYQRIACRMIKNIDGDGIKSYLSWMKDVRFSKSEKIDYYHDEIVKYWEESIICYPLQETYKEWYEQVKDLLSSSKCEKVLEEWHTNFPSDNNALLYLVSSCRVRGVYKKAKTYCDILKNLIPGHPELVLLNNCLFIDTALYHFLKGRDLKCLKILDTLEKPKEIFIKVLKELLYYSAFSRLYPKKDAAQYLENLASLKQPVMILFFIQNILSDHKYSISKKKLVFLEEQCRDPDITVQSLYDVFTIPDTIWGKTAYFPVFINNCIFRNTTLDSYILDVCFQKAIEKYGCNLNLSLLFNPCLWDLTAEGLKRNDEFVAKFLFYRGLIIMIHFRTSSCYYKTREIYIERVSSLVGAAMKIAENKNNISLLHYFESMLEEFEYIDEIEDLAETLTDIQISRIIELEKEMKFDCLNSYLTEKETKNMTKKKAVKQKVYQSEDNLPDVFQPDLFGEL